jgi:hypothetical protein
MVEAQADLHAVIGAFAKAARETGLEHELLNRPDNSPAVWHHRQIQFAYGAATTIVRIFRFAAAVRRVWSPLVLAEYTEPSLCV